MKEIGPPVYDEWYLTPFGALCHRLERDALFSLAAFKPGELVLDAGCGTGVYLKELKDAGARPVGLDADAAMLCAAKARGLGVPLVRASLEAMPFKSASFGGIISVCSLEFVANAALAFKELSRALSAGGLLLVGFLNLESSWAEKRLEKGRDPESPWHGVRFFSLAEVEMLGAGAGLKLAGFRSAVHFPPEAEGSDPGKLEAAEAGGAVLFSRAAFTAAKFRRMDDQEQFVNPRLPP